MRELNEVYETDCDIVDFVFLVIILDHNLHCGLGSRSHGSIKALLVHDLRCLSARF